MKVVDLPHVSFTLRCSPQQPDVISSYLCTELKLVSMACRLQPLQARGQMLHYSEFGVGGGTTMDGTSPATNGAQVSEAWVHLSACMRGVTHTRPE
jgi:hypothetical protein